MQIPSADQFRPERDPGNPRLPVRWFAPIADEGYDLHVPEGAEGEADAASVAFAGVVLSSLDAIMDEAVEHMRKYADAERLGIGRGRPDVHGVFCDARYERVEIGFSWEAQMYILWTVAFRWDGAGRRSPVELSVRPR
ncbi:MAG TPA: hypothetical protein VGC13_17090 [Longimicrobium sp.]|jgi:hypothetical protein|uniref:hypothetical protein n=1 Tax=Longimicrobium sp. TaxID=2029185 RepID=UPI002EDAEEB1